MNQILRMNAVLAVSLLVKFGECQVIVFCISNLLIVYHFGSNLMQYYYIIHRIGYLFLSNIM